MIDMPYLTQPRLELWRLTKSEGSALSKSELSKKRTSLRQLLMTFAKHRPCFTPPLLDKLHAVGLAEGVENSHL
jgi:hypothetical protein